LSYPPAYEDEIECSEISAYKIQTPGNYPEECIQHAEHGKSLKSRLPILAGNGTLIVPQDCSWHWLPRNICL